MKSDLLVHLTVCVALALAPAVLAREAAPNHDASVQKEQKMPDDLLKTLVGSWEGVCRTWFEPGKLADESPIKGKIHSLLDGRFFRHSYESTIRGKPRHGEETMAFNAVTERFQTTWLDDFHMNYALLFSEGEASERGFAVNGTYDVGPDSPPWGWKTVYKLTDDNHLSITAYNISPDGAEAKAVETIYSRSNE